MKAKSLLYFLATIIVIVAIFYVTSYGNKEKIATDNYLEWFNGWTADLIKIKTLAHERAGLITIPKELRGDDLTNPEKLKEFRNFIEQMKELELWKMDTGSVINDKWYNKIDQLLAGKATNEQVLFAKNKLLEGEKIVADFRKVSVIYFDDYFNLINFMYNAVNDAVSLGRKIDNNDINNADNLQTIYNQSQENYNNAVNKIYDYDVKRLEEFNNQFKNDNITKILNQVKGKQIVTSVSTCDTEIVSFANEINKVCPYMIDKETRLDNVNPFNASELQFNYTLINHVKDSSVIKTLNNPIFYSALVNKIKTSPELKKYRDKNLTWIYTYFDKNGLFISRLTIKHEQYIK